MKVLKIFFFLFSPVFLFAQSTTTLNVKETEEFRDDVHSAEIIAIHTNPEGHLGIVRQSRKKLFFEIFDKRLKRAGEVDVNIDKKENHIGSVFFDNEIKSLTVHAPDRKTRIVYCYVFNIRDKNHERIKLFETTVEKKQGLFNLKSKRLTNVAISPNGQYIAITTDNIRKNINSYTIRVFDSETMEVVFKKAYQKHAKKYYQHNDLVVDNDATVYSLGKLFQSGKFQRNMGNANYKFVLNKMMADDYEELLINIDDERIQSLILSSFEDQIQINGFYSEKKEGRIKGGCSFIIDKEQFVVKAQKATVLPVEVYEDLYGERKSKRKKKNELSALFDIDFVLTDASGTTYMLAEEFYTTTRYNGAGVGGAGITETVFHYDDILILMFNKDGDVEWGRSINKKANNPSYHPFVKEDKLHVIFNSGKSLKAKKDGRTVAKKRLFESTALYDFVYTTEGKVSRDKIQNNKGNTFYLPQIGFFDGQKFVMMSGKRKKRKFMILE